MHDLDKIDTSVISLLYYDCSSGVNDIDCSSIELWCNENDTHFAYFIKKCK